VFRGEADDASVAMVAAFNRSRWEESIGTGGGNGPENALQPSELDSHRLQ